MTNVIGQDQLVSELDRVVNIFVTSECKLRPHFILTGPSGSGKTITARALAEKHGVKYLEINAAQLTKEGTSGNSLSKALAPITNFGNKPTLIFVDEFDKLFISGNVNTDLSHETTNGVQNEFLSILEGKTTQVYGDYAKYHAVPTDKLLFIFAGAFNNEPDITIDRLREFGLKTEFLGRVGLCFATSELTIDDLYRIVDESELLINYCKLFEDADLEKVSLLIKGYLKDNHDKNTIGARLVNTLINQYFIKGSLPASEVEKISFQKTLKMDHKEDY